MKMKQARIYYSGTVQGVGFRYRSQSIALGFKISGRVRNLPDGRVEIIAQGAKKEINNFIKSIDESFDGYIRNKQISFEEADEISKGFDISF